MDQRAETLRLIVRSVVKFALIVFVGLTISSELGFNIAPLLASVGIVGVAVGFGAQSLVKDVISGFFILLEDQYSVGDVIRVGTSSGVVERMSLRATVLRNLEGRVHIIPNGTIQTVTVLTKEWARAVVEVTVSYHCGPAGQGFQRAGWRRRSAAGRFAGQRHPEKPRILGGRAAWSGWRHGPLPCQDHADEAVGK